MGSELAVALDRDGHQVAVLDKVERSFRRLPPGWAGRTVVGFGFDRDHLSAAGATQADALAAVTSGDNSNILTARIARENFDIANVVARIYDPRRALIYQRLGIPTVATVTWTTDQAMRRLLPDRSVTEWSDHTSQLRLVERALPESWAGRPLAELNADDTIKVVSLSRASTVMLATDNLVAQEGDLVHIAVRKEALDELDHRINEKVETDG